MAGEVSFKVDGLREIEEAFDELSTATARNQSRNALKAGGQITANRAKDLVHKLTGHMGDSIGVGTKLTRRQKRLHKKTADIEVFVGPNDAGQIGLEFGHEGVAPEPFMRPAWEETQKPVLDKIVSQLRTNVDKAVARARRKAARTLAKSGK